MAKNKKRKLSGAAKPSSSAEPTDDVPVDHEDSNPDADPDAAEDPAPTDDPTATEIPIETETQQQTLETQQQTTAPDAAAAAAAATTDTAIDDEDFDPASIQKLLEPFSKDQLAGLLRDAAVKHSDVLKEIQRIADVDPAHRKIFVHGLGWDTNADTLRAVFGEFGEIEDCKAVTDKATGKSKGYGFILFKHRAGADRALKQPQKKIGSRMTSCQLASAGPVPSQPQQQVQPAVPAASEYTQRKIFVSNVGAEVDPQKLLQFFSEFGEVEEGPLGLDKATGKPKGFALFVYKTVESARKALEVPHKNFEGHMLHCQKAIDGPKPHKLGFQFQHGGAGGGVGSLGSQYGRNDGAGSLGGGRNQLGNAGHLMAPPATGLGFNQAAQLPTTAATGLNPTLGHALTAFLATQGAGLNLIGNLGSTPTGGSVANPGVVGNYGSQVPGVNNGAMGSYGAMQGGYSNASAGRGAGRSQHGLGHMGGVRPYRG